MKFSLYNHWFNKGTAFYLYNCWLSKIVRFSTQEELAIYKELKDKKKLSKKNKLVKVLYDQGFIVDDGIDEYDVAKNWAKKAYEASDKLTVYIYVTNQCNFRCVYCPQEHESRTLSTKNWDALYKFIYKKIKSKECNLLRVYLFGGEPLLESKSIIKFLDKLRLLRFVNSSFRVNHYIVTNGYLLTSKIYDSLVSLGVQVFQITIDGMGDAHNMNRHLVNGGGTWKKIIKNLKYINSKNDHAMIYIRSNIDKMNIDSVKLFHKWFDENFDNKKFIYTHNPIVLFDDNADRSNELSKDSTEFVSFVGAEQRKYTQSFIHKYNHMEQRLSFACNCAQKNYYVVTADGEIAKCDTARRAIGKLESSGDITYYNDLSSYDSYETEQCETCTVYPLCGARDCPERWALRGNHERCMLTQGDIKTFMETNVELCSVIEAKTLFGINNEA